MAVVSLRKEVAKIVKSLPPCQPPEMDNLNVERITCVDSKDNPWESHRDRVETLPCT